MRLSHLFLFTSSFFSIFALATRWRQGHPCPESIKTVLPNSDRPLDENENGHTFDSMVAVHEALTTCPNISSLDLRVTLMGCSSWPDRFNFPFRLAGGERYPALKELRLEGYNFDERPWEKLALGKSYGLPWYESLTEWLLSGTARKWWNARALDIDQRNKTNLDLWLDAMDWSHLEALAVLDRPLPLKDVPRLRSLEKLDLSGSDVENAREVIQTLPSQSLTSLTIVRSAEMLELETILSHQGKSLTVLELRSPEVQSKPSPAFNISELQFLPQLAPNLQHLSINVHRNGSWPLGTLEAISTNPSLRSVDIWFDIVSECRRQKPEAPHIRDVRKWEATHGVDACNGEDQYQRPYIDQSSSLELFRYMRVKKIGQELANVTFWVGDWTRAWDGPLYFADWLEHRRSKVSCSIRAEGGEEGWCVVEDGKEYWKRGKYWDWGGDDDYDMVD
ncbi:hypothetical protein K491DRAFT_36989 [Lophiostoma macrostomum CBS 122681]|uniref:RNI-like protein n=1 Tax=Lophiostoma macrostomum CBS 122681 TaxID=1314788 RepID=A0A6A6TKN5_9PLEO|nr:hypothetical protein K491DRAFT_36989 [Lophiostoma macrostomum CBS 122681]